MIFSRKKAGTGRHSADRKERSEEVAATPARSPARARGPYDISEAPDGVERLDLGALQIPAIEGVEVRVQADPEGQVQQVILVHEESALQLGAFAAPRSDGIWDEVREDIRTQLFDDGVAAQDAKGTYGTELRARVRTPDGLTDIRFVGVDGPRWMVRAVFQGPAATDPAAAGPLDRCLRGLVVDRGNEAMPVREALPLRLPVEMAEAAAAESAAQNPDGRNGTPGPRPRPSPRSGGGTAKNSRRKPSPRPRESG